MRNESIVEFFLITVQYYAICILFSVLYECIVFSECFCSRLIL